MSNEIAVFNPASVPAFARNRKELSAVAKALSGGAGGGGKRVSIRGGVFRLISGGKEVAAIDERYLDVVVVNAAPKVSRVFYAKTYDSDAAAAPDCWSADGDTPSADAADKQASRCSECPQNIAGSGNGNSRACRYQQRVAVVLANDVEGDVLQLALPATSIFGKEEGDNRPLQAYTRWLAAQNIDITEVVTRLRFDTKSESPKLFFKAQRWLTDGEMESCTTQSKSDDAIRAITMTVAKMDNVPAVSEPLEGARPKKAEPPKKAKAEPVETVADEVPEPAVRKEAKKPSAVPSKASLADMVDDWDAE